MTTKVSILERKIEVLQEQKQKISSERWKCEARFQAALTRCFQKYFRGVVSEDVSIVCTNTTINFKMLDEDCREREIFQIYLRENYMMKERSENAYRDAQLSYYSTSTNSDFELQRLENLGRVATIVRKGKEGILDKANELAKIYDAELAMEKFFEREDEVSTQISLLREEINTLNKEKIKSDLISEGVEFSKGVDIQMKYNYTPTIKSIKLVDVSKSGKKGTAIFDWVYGNNPTSREENVSVNSIIDQVLGYTKDIVQHSFAE
jgi:hypothetical protein